MTAETFEYAIKKDVRNNPIVREVDRERHRDMWRSALVGGFLVVVLLFSAWQHFELIHHGYVMEQLHQQKTAEEEIRRRLRLEIEALSSPRRIEEVAIKELRMVEPARDNAIVIERVTPSAPPDKSVVAAR
jgi:cell division protein FtsL